MKSYLILGLGLLLFAGCCTPPKTEVVRQEIVELDWAPPHFSNLTPPEGEYGWRETWTHEIRPLRKHECAQVDTGWLSVLVEHLLLAL